MKCFDSIAYEIAPEVPYTDDGLAYYTNGWADREQNDSTARPAISESVANKAAFNFETKSVTVNSSYTIPINGLGMYSLHGGTCVNSGNSALASGVLLINTASAYSNREEVGQASHETIDEGIIEKNCIFSIFHSTYKLVLAINVFCPFVAYHPHIPAAGVRLHLIGVGTQSGIHVPRRGIP